jgi:predicted RNase H-like nuclease
MQTFATVGVRFTPPIATLLPGGSPDCDVVVVRRPEIWQQRRNRPWAVATTSQSRPRSDNDPMYAGVDGCAKGWVAFVVPTQRLVEGFPSFADLAGHLRELGVTTIGVDMPIEPPETGARECDLAVKKALGPKASSLFITPTRAALACATQAEATVVNKEHGGAGVSAQAFALRHKIREVEQAGVDGVIEVHPELTFHLLGAPAIPEAQLGRRA